VCVGGGGGWVGVGGCQVGPVGGGASGRMHMYLHAAGGHIPELTGPDTSRRGPPAFDAGFYVG
jgi:hypothetical protein